MSLATIPTAGKICPRICFSLPCWLERESISLLDTVSLVLQGTKSPNGGFGCGFGNQSPPKARPTKPGFPTYILLDLLVRGMTESGFWDCTGRAFV